MPNDDKKHDLFIAEYQSLRAEILQTYEQQIRLIFISAIAASAILFGAVVKDYAVGLAGLPALIAILIGIAFKSKANYEKIFRIGSYLAVVHEQQGKSENEWSPKIDEAAWHTRWRQIARGNRVKWAGGSGVKAEGIFLGALALAGWFVVGAKIVDGSIFCTEEMVLLLVSIILSFVLLESIRRLIKISDVSKLYEVVFREEILLSKK